MAKLVKWSAEWRLQEALNLARAAQAKWKLNNKTIQYLQKLAWLKKEWQKIDRNFAPVGWYTPMTDVPYTDPYWDKTTKPYWVINWLDVWWAKVIAWDVSPKSSSPLARKATPPIMRDWENKNTAEQLKNEEQALLNEYRNWRIRPESDLNWWVMRVWHPENWVPEEWRIRNAALEWKLTPERKFSENEINTYNWVQGNL